MPFRVVASVTGEEARVVSQSNAFVENIAGSHPTRSRLQFALGGLLAGVMIGGGILGLEYLVRRRNLHDMALPSYLFVYPLVGLGLGWLGYRNEHAWRLVRPRDFFSDLPLPSEEAAARGERTRRFVWIGFGLGIAVALLATALEFAWRGWPFLAGTFASGFLMYPYFGMLVGYNVSLRPGGPRPSIRNFRFRVGTLMILVAYVGVLCGVGSIAARYSQLAAEYRAKSLNARTLADAFQSLLKKEQPNLTRAENAKELRAGRIPDGIEPSQIAFLKGLEGKSSGQYKQYQYGLIADGEDRQAQMSTQIVPGLTRSLAHYKKLAEKYSKAEQEPWVAVAPDPPMP
jgi:hypothetical protein